MIDRREFIDQNFWWLHPLGFDHQGSVRLARSRWISPDEAADFCEESDSTTVERVFDWARFNQFQNVHRSLCIRLDEPARDVWGPFLIDIDIEHDQQSSDGIPSFDEFDQASVWALEKAAALTMSIVARLLDDGQSQDQIRVFFSGHKGFHVETVFPDRVDEMHGKPKLHMTWDTVWKKCLDDLRLQLVPSESVATIDRAERTEWRGFVRLRGTLNRFGPANYEKAFQVVPISLERLESMNIDDILTATSVWAI